MTKLDNETFDRLVEDEVDRLRDVRKIMAEGGHDVPVLMPTMTLFLPRDGKGRYPAQPLILNQLDPGFDVEDVLTLLGQKVARMELSPLAYTFAYEREERLTVLAGALSGQKRAESFGARRAEALGEAEAANPEPIDAFFGGFFRDSPTATA